jgi:hypothetical protein
VWFSHYGERTAVLTVETADENQPSFWVASGGGPTNLYPKSQFASPDYVFSFHTDLMSRLSERQFQEADKPGEDELYYVFICHASEDKEEFVKPPVRELNRQGLWVWYDEFELEIGDSLRRSIDQGLSGSHCGIVVLSESFFGKSWTEYELNGLTAREIEGERPLVLPVWYNIDRSDVTEHSPPLADKVAIVTDGEDIESVAKELRGAVGSRLQDG